MNSRAFSLSELLIALCLAFVMLYFLRPISNPTLESARKASAKNDVRNIATAVSAYIVEYERPPSTNLAAQNLDGALLQALMGSNALGLNPRRIVFLKAQQAKNGKSGLTDGAFVDPWGGPYRILLDADRDGMIVDAGSFFITNRMVQSNVAVWNDSAQHKDAPDSQEMYRRAVKSW